MLHPSGLDNWVEGVSFVVAVALIVWSLVRPVGSRRKRPDDES